MLYEYVDVSDNGSNGSLNISEQKLPKPEMVSIIYVHIIKNNKSSEIQHSYNLMRSEVPTTVSMKITLSQEVTPCGLLGRYTNQPFGRIYFLYFSVEFGNGKFRCNVDNSVADHTASHTRKQ
jgi:hypothetical protein